MCDDGWGEEEARTVCRSLGYKAGQPTKESKFGPVPRDLVILNCRGGEDRLEDCRSITATHCDIEVSLSSSQSIRNARECQEGAGVICSTGEVEATPQPSLGIGTQFSVAVVLMVVLVLLGLALWKRENISQFVNREILIKHHGEGLLNPNFNSSE